MDVYFAASLTGGREQQDLVRGLVNFLEGAGHNVLNKFIGAENWRDAFRENAGYSVEAWDALASAERRQIGFQTEVAWIERAGCLIAEVSSPGSYGVGGEIQHAFMKPRLGLPFTPVLCLYAKERGEPTSTWIRGRNPAAVWLRPYASLEDAERIVQEFFEGFHLE